MSQFTRSQPLSSPASRLQPSPISLACSSVARQLACQSHNERLNRGASVLASLGCELKGPRPSWLARKASGRTTRLGVRITPQRERHPVVATDQMTEEVARAGAR